ncbi:osmiophilic body protein, putative [Plasmodium knowlesi strain H]|uniref:Osmiophilic body protein, putative n=3 Tax=Plasmodium knowlesi TaxID=5850 RepID=A0A5K1VMF1_PLAKH|nr:osmiophilic body protein G377, putative [Plasmodium knowlesi strain H]OTN63604.1 putative Osmiophilic body protein [Plasmodium knowlesi]CAA9991298.1 osmiophilic body protein G377, putative [Plasmodium knowlesi strain H]SBO26399.1 osmiophilic body protein, putative [Plasmodium knowlesi strain H]SBO28995.1 osmiophilic body protein, putative [Plasmodium knowlesi strain H]VVS80772.1 osmiophilic body protein G377, putative [Plasmodium knowlesi strain H]|eukprot:XP_002262577.1 pfg377 homolog, putative [Plasmodium knowlesi strain H]
MRFSLCATLLCLLCGLAKCRKGLNFDQIIKYLKETKVIPEHIPDTLEDAIQIVPPYIIYKYKGKIYYLHNNVDITPVDERKTDPVFPVHENELEAINPLECHPVVPGIDGAVSPVLPESVTSEEVADTIKMVLDEDTGIMVATNTNVIIEKEKHTVEGFTIPQDAQWSSEDKEKNKNVYLFGGENSTVYKVKEIIQYKENKDMCKNIQIGYERFYSKPSSYGDDLGITSEEKSPKIVHNVDTKDYSSFLTALHILFRKDEEIGVEKIYKINNIPKTDLLLFIKQAYKNIHDTLKNYILVSGFSFYDYTYDVGSFSLDVFMNDFFFLSNNNNKDRGTFKNVTSSIKYASTAKDKLSVYKIEKAIKDFLAESNLRVLDLKLIHHLFSRNFILNCTENDIVDFVTNLVNITGVDISPRIGATIFAYLLQKVNIYLMPSYPTKTRNSYLLFMENNDLLFFVESIYRDIFKNFYRISNSHGDLPNAQNLDQVLALTPWVQKIYPNFGSTYDFLTMKYGLSLFYNTYHMIINFFQGDIKMKQILLEHKESKKVDTLDKFLNEVLALFPQGSSSSVWPSSLLSMAQVEEKPRGRVLSEDKISGMGEESNEDDDEDDDVPDDEDDEESKEAKEAQEEATADENHADVYAREKNKYNELRQIVETELIKERKEYAQKKHDEEERIKKEEQEKIAETDKKHELETQALEAEEAKTEPDDDAKFEKDYQASREQERESARRRIEASIKDGTYNAHAEITKPPDSFYYSTSLNALYDQMKKEYEKGVDSGFQVVAEIEAKLNQVYKTLARKGVPDYAELKDEVIEANQKLFEELSTKVKNEESRKKNILEYKSELDTCLEKIMAKNEDGQYNITAGLIMQNFKKYQNDLMEQCEKGFYGKFRKSLGSRKKIMLKKLREALKYSIRIMQDLAPSYDEAAYTKTFTDIYMTKKESYKKDYITARRVISKNMDIAFRKHIKLHYEEIDVEIRKELQIIRQEALKKIDEIYAELFNIAHVEVQIDLESIKNEKLKMKKKVFQIVRQNTNYPNDLKLLESTLAKYNADETAEGKSKKDQLNADITKLKATIEKNKTDAASLITHFQSISEKYEQVLIKMDAIDYLEKRFRLFRFEVAKEYKDSNLHTDALVPLSNKDAGEYIRIESITKDLLNDLDQINYDIHETRILLHSLKTKKKHIELDIQIGEKLYKMEEKADINTMNDKNKEKLKEVVTDIENEEHKLEKLYIRRDIFMKDLNFIVSDSEKDPPETIKFLLPELIQKTDKKNLENFLIEIMMETEIENNALTNLIKTFNKDVLFYKYHIINPYDYLQLPTDEKNIDEKFSAQVHKNSEMFAQKLESFRVELKKYRKLVKNQGGLKQTEALTYLKRNIAHLKNMIHSLRNGIHIEDFSYILTSPDFFQNKGIKNEDMQSEQAHTSLVKSYLSLNSLGKVLTDTQNKALHFGIHYKYTSDKVLWYLAILKKYIERTEMVYNNSYDGQKKSSLLLPEFIKNKADLALEHPVLLQYGGDIWDGSWGFAWGEAADKKKYLRVVKKEQTYPYKLKEIKDVYVVDKIVKEKLVRTGKLDSLKEYMHVKVYNIVEVKDSPITLFDKEELKQLKLLTPDGHITQGSVKNYLTHLGFMSKGGANVEGGTSAEEHLPAILQTAAEYLKQSNISYDAILEVLKYLKATPNAINVRDIITLSEIILDNSNVFFVKEDTLSIYIITFLDLLGVQVNMDDIQRKDKKSRVMTYLSILKSYYKKVEIKEEIKKHVLRFLRPSDAFPTLSYNPKLHEFLLGVQQSLDGNKILYEAFKKENTNFSTELLSGIKKGISDFMNYILAKVATYSPEHFKSKYYHEHKYNQQEMEVLRITSYSTQRINFGTLMTLFFYFVNPDLRNMLHEHVIKADLSCLDKFSTFDFKDIFSITSDTQLIKLFHEKIGHFQYGRTHSLVYLWRYLLHPDNKEFFTYEKVSSVVEKYFSHSVFDDNTRTMLSKLAYSFLARMSYHTVSYFDIQIEHLIEKSDIELISLFHNILNKLNFLLYCTNSKPYLERYAPANLLSYTRPFKLDALKIFHQFVNSLPHYLRSYIVNFFETDFSEITENLIVDLFHHIQSFLENDSSSFESEKENKIESFFKLNYFFTKNKNVTDGNYQSMIQEDPKFKDAKIIFNRRVKYDHVNKKSNYQENLHLADLIDEQSFKMLLQTLIKEQISFDEVNEKFKNFMNTKKLVFPKFDILKTKITKTADDLYYLKIYKYLYDTFQKMHVTQPIHDLYFLFIKVLLDYYVAPFKFKNEHVQEDLHTELARKYQKYIEFLSQLFPCLFNFYYYDDTVLCQNFGNYSEEEFSPEQKMLNILQTPFVQLPQTVQNNQINLDYHINEEDLFFDFIKEFIPESGKMDQNQLKVESFKIRYFITEISKFVMRKVMSKMPSSYIFNMGYKDFYINVDDIVNNLQPLFEQVRKVKEPSDSVNSSYGVISGTIANFMDTNNAEASSFRFQNIKFYLNSHVTQLFLQNNMSFKYFMDFIKNIDKFKTYFPSLSELYVFVDKHVNIINAITHPNFTERVTTQGVIQIFVDTLKNFGVDLYEI